MVAVILDFVQRNPYLFSNVPGLAVVILLAWRTRHRDYARAAIFSGLACVPCSLAEVTATAYWRPKMLGGMTWGIESAIFTFMAGTAVWLIAAASIRRECAIGTRAFSEVFRRMTPGALAVTALYVALWRTGVNCVTAALTAPAGLLVWVLIRRPGLARLSVAGFGFWIPLYFFMVRAQFAFWPDYSSYWNPGGTWGTRFLGVPLGEIAWAAIMGSIWPVAIAWALDVRLEKRAPAEGEELLPVQTDARGASLLAQPDVCMEEKP
jgi:hypothetical protein